MSKTTKIEWQRRKRRQFAAEHGYSETSNRGCGGLRKAVLERDNHGCTYQRIADQVGLSIGAVHKWVKRWERESAQSL